MHNKRFVTLLSRFVPCDAEPETISPLSVLIADVKLSLDKPNRFLLLLVVAFSFFFFSNVLCHVKKWGKPEIF